MANQESWVKTLGKLEKRGDMGRYMQLEENTMSLERVWGWDFYGTWSLKKDELAEIELEY